MDADDVTERGPVTSADSALEDAGIMLLSADAAMLACNHHVERLTGYEFRALGELHLDQLFEPAGTLDEVIRRLRAGESHGSVQIDLRTADAKLLPVEVRGELLQSLDRSDARIILQIRAAGRYRGQRQRWTNLPLLGHLAGELSHEIRNPMNAIFLHADIVEEEVRQPVPGDCSQVGQSLATIKAELTRLNGLIQDYLFLARLADLELTPTDLCALVEDLAHELHPQCALRGVCLDVNGLGPLGEVALHQSMFRRALFNVLRLLIDAAPRNTTLFVSSARTNCHTQLQIRDPKTAIPAEVWASLQDSLQAKTPEPANLRIYVAHEIVAAHGGAIAVGDDTQAGRLCTIRLPVGTKS